MIPKGWRIALTGGDEIIVSSPGGNGMTLPAGDGGTLAVRLLRDLAAALLAEQRRADDLAAIAPKTPADRAAQQWYAHENVLRASMLPDTLRIAMCLNHDGMLCEREGVIDNGEWALGVLGVRVVAEKTTRYAQEMIDSITAAKRAHTRGGDIG